MKPGSTDLFYQMALNTDAADAFHERDFFCVIQFMVSDRLRAGLQDGNQLLCCKICRKKSLKEKWRRRIARWKGHKCGSDFLINCAEWKSRWSLSSTTKKNRWSAMTMSTVKKTTTACVVVTYDFDRWYCSCSGRSIVGHERAIYFRGGAMLVREGHMGQERAMWVKRGAMWACGGATCFRARSNVIGSHSNLWSESKNVTVQYFSYIDVRKIVHWCRISTIYFFTMLYPMNLLYVRKGGISPAVAVRTISTRG